MPMETRLDSTYSELRCISVNHGDLESLLGMYLDHARPTVFTFSENPQSQAKLESAESASNRSAEAWSEIRTPLPCPKKIEVSKELQKWMLMSLNEATFLLVHLDVFVCWSLMSLMRSIAVRILQDEHDKVVVTSRTVSYALPVAFGIHWFILNHLSELELANHGRSYVFISLYNVM